MDGFATLNLTLSGSQPTKEGFQVIVGTVAFGPGITLEESPPALAEGRADVADHLRLWWTGLRVLLQLGEKLLDLALDLLAGRARLPLDLWRVEAALEFHQPAPLTFKLSILRAKGAAELDHRQQLRQERMTPFLALRLSEDSIRAKSSNTRRPPSTNGGLLASVRVRRINSA